MSRKVFISSGMAHDETLIEVAEENPTAALIWPWILTTFDDWGRAAASAKSIKHSVLPSISSVTSANVQEAIDLYAQLGLIECYEVAGKPYMAVPPAKWFKHQSHIRHDKHTRDDSKVPAPPCWGAWIESKSRQSADESAEVETVAQTREDARNNAQSREKTYPRGRSSPSLTPSPSLTEENTAPSERESAREAGTELFPETVPDAKETDAKETDAKEPDAKETDAKEQDAGKVKPQRWSVSSPLHPAVALFHEKRKQQPRGRAPTRVQSEEKAAADHWADDESAFRRALDNYFNGFGGTDPWPKSQGFTFIAFLRQYDRWADGSPLPPRTSTPYGNRNEIPSARSVTAAAPPQIPLWKRNKERAEQAQREAAGPPGRDGPD